MIKYLHAMLIGIDFYFPNKLDNGCYESLTGSVRDIEAVEEFLLNGLVKPPERVIKLTASRGAGAPVEPQERLPTYENIVKAFRSLVIGAHKGDQVYIHFSGHGARLATQFPEQKREGYFVEALVPCDIGVAGSRYLLDTDIATLLREMSSKGIFTTLVLDCCHSGGMINWNNEGLAGCIIIAACRPQELSFEYSVDSGAVGGALTSCLLESLRYSGTDITYKQLHGRIVAKLHGASHPQYPFAFGDLDRVFLSAKRVAGRETIIVLSVEPTRVLLDVGAAHGVKTGARFTLHLPGAVRSHTPGLAVVEISELGATKSWADVIESRQQGALAQSAFAVPFVLAPTCEIVSCLENCDVAIGEIVRIRLKSVGESFIRVAEEGELEDFTIFFANNEMKIGSLGSIIDACSTVKYRGVRSINKLLGQLLHMSRYRNVCRIQNQDEESPFWGRLSLVVVGTQASFSPGDLPNPQPWNEQAPVELQQGEWIFLKIYNNSARVLNVAALELRPDWSITQVFPGRSGTSFWPLDPGEGKSVYIQAWLPEGVEEGIGMIKFFGTIGSTNFRWLELPPLSQAPPAKASNGKLGDVSAGTPMLRHQSLSMLSMYSSEEWIVVEVVFKVHRK